MVTNGVIDLGEPIKISFRPIMDLKSYQLDFIPLSSEDLSA